MESYLKDFYTKGYFVIENLFKAHEVAEISKSFENLLKIAAGKRTTEETHGSQFVVEGTQVKRIVWACGAEPKLLPFGRDKRITQVVANILDSASFDHLICQAHYKLPNDGVYFPWHQDSENRGYGTPSWKDVNGKGSYVQTVMAIDEATIENGPLYVFPGSCLKGHLALNEGQNTEKNVREEDMVPLLLKPGSVVFFGPYLIHGSKENRSTKPRRIFINGFSYPGANFKTYPGDGSGARISIY